MTTAPVHEGPLHGLPRGFQLEDWGPGKSVIVTGGTTGIGRAVAILLGSRGARVVICGRHQRELDDALRELERAGAEAKGVVADVSRPEDVAHLFEFADDWLGGLDVLVNNAGLAAGDAGGTDPESIATVVGTNLSGPMYCTHHALARLRQRKQGTIVTVGSMSADVRETGSSVYVATKSGLQGFCGALRKEVGEDGVRVVLIEPGAVGTDMNENSPDAQRQKQAAEDLLTAEDIALVVLGTLSMPRRADVVEVSVRPLRQPV